MSELISTPEYFEIETCITCGVRYLIPATLRTQLKRCKNTFYCPSGHAQSYTQSEAERLQKVIEGKDQELTAVYKDRDNALARAIKAERALKKITK